MPFKTFDNLEMGPPDPILGVKTKFMADPSPEKINVSVGAYRDNQGQPYVLNVVRKAEERILSDNKRVKEYLPIAGDAEFREASKKFCFGPDAQLDKIATVQALSGTGALRVGAEFICKHYPGTKVFISDPTWGNHFKIFGNAGLETAKYRYWNPKTLGLDIDGMLEDISRAPAGSVVVLHASAHNPTGVDPTAEQWKEILDLIEKKQLLPFFDSAYQGYATGDADADAFAIRLFEKAGLEMLAAQSYSKNLGLYGERVGALNVVCGSKEAVPKVLSQLELVIRPMYSNPPRHGAAIAATVLNDPELRKEWQKELAGMTDRIKDMRAGLKSALEGLNAPGEFSFITNQTGMFAYTGLSAEQVESMRKSHNIYMTSNGRISMAGVTPSNIKRLSEAIRSVL